MLRATAVCSLTLLLAATLPSVLAQTINSASWSTGTYFQGDSGSVTIVLSNSHSYQICTKQFYIQFDWQQSQNLIFASSDTPCIATGQSYSFVIPFNVPSATSVGAHTYKIVWVDNGFLLGTSTLTTATLQVHDAFEKVYNALQPTVSQALTTAQAANFRSTTAQSDLTQAGSYYNQATSLAGQGQYQNAVNDLNQAQTSIGQANSAEQAYQASNNNGLNAVAGGLNNALNPAGSGSGSSGSSSVLLYGAIFIVVIIIIAVVALARRGKSRGNSPNPK